MDENAPSEDRLSDILERGIVGSGSVSVKTKLASVTSPSVDPVNQSHSSKLNPYSYFK